MTAAFPGPNRGVSRPTDVPHLAGEATRKGRSATLLTADRQGCASVRFRQGATAGSPGVRDASGLAADALDRAAGNRLHNRGDAR